MLRVRAIQTDKIKWPSTRPATSCLSPTSKALTGDAGRSAARRGRYRFSVGEGFAQLASISNQRRPRPVYPDVPGRLLTLADARRAGGCRRRGRGDGRRLFLRVRTRVVIVRLRLQYGGFHGGHAGRRHRIPLRAVQVPSCAPLPVIRHRRCAAAK